MIRLMRIMCLFIQFISLETLETLNTLFSFILYCVKMQKTTMNSAVMSEGREGGAILSLFFLSLFFLSLFFLSLFFLSLSSFSLFLHLKINKFHHERQVKVPHSCILHTTTFLHVIGADQNEGKREKELGKKEKEFKEEGREREGKVLGEICFCFFLFLSLVAS